MTTVAVIGASANEERYSNKAMKMLAEHGHTPVPIAPTSDPILGRVVFPSLADTPQPIDTVTVYLSPKRQATLLEQVVSAKPRRVIFNPGTENPELAARLREAGVDTVEACTLVMLRTGQF